MHLGCNYTRGMDWMLDLLTTCIHYSELQVITALSLVSTFYKSLHAKSFSVCNVSNNCCLAKTSNNGESSASRPHVVTLRRMSRNWTLSAGLRSSLYSLGADPTENTASNIPSFVVMGACLRSDIVDGFTEPLPRNACSFPRSLHSNGTTRCNIFSSRCCVTAKNT
jgi:hypothetical protein